MRSKSSENPVPIPGSPCGVQPAKSRQDNAATVAGAEDVLSLPIGAPVFIQVLAFDCLVVWAPVVDVGNEVVVVVGIHAAVDGGEPEGVIVSADGSRTIVNHSPAELLTQPCPDLDDVACDAVLVDGRWPAGTAGALSLARRRDLPGVVDVDRSAVDAAVIATCFELASHLVFSEDALREPTGALSPSDGLRRIARDTGAHVSVTLGARGVVWLDGDDVCSLGAFPVDALDTTGAGDLWAAGFLFGLTRGYSVKKCGRLASACGYEVCQVVGAAISDEGWARITKITEE